MVKGRQCGRGGDRRHRNPECHRQVDDLLRGAGQRPLRHHADELVAALDPASERRQLGVVDQVGAIDQHQEVLELLCRDSAEADQAIGGGNDRRQLQTTGLHKGIRAQHAGGHGGQTPHPDHHRLVRRHVDDLAAAAPGGTPGRGRGNRRCERSRQPLAEPAAGLHGFVARPASAGGGAAQRLQDELVGDHLVVDERARHSEGCHAHHHRRRAGVGGDAVQCPAVGQVGEHDVGTGQQRHDLGPGPVDDRLLPRGQVAEQCPRRSARRPATHRIPLG